MEAASKKPTLSQKSITLKTGKTKRLKVKNTKGKIRWYSTNEKVASVSKKGTVKAKNPGKATIYARVGKKKLKYVDSAYVYN